MDAQDTGNELPQLMTMDEVSKMTRRPVETLRYWRKRGYGPRGFRVGRAVMYDRQDVRAFLDECRSAAA